MRCDVCNDVLPLSEFHASAIRRGKFCCKQHAAQLQREYKRTPSGKLAVLAATIRERQRKRLGDRECRINGADVAAVCERYGWRCVLSDEHAPRGGAKNLTLVRVDASRPLSRENGVPVLAASAKSIGYLLPRRLAAPPCGQGAELTTSSASSRLERQQSPSSSS
jgi:hypothetical protein